MHIRKHSNRNSFETNEWLLNEKLNPTVLADFRKGNVILTGLFTGLKQDKNKR